MAEERYAVRLTGVAGGALPGEFVLDEDADGESSRLALQFGGGEITAEASDYFEAMCRIRERLEAGTGLRPACFGASRNVYPSSMARDMGRGLKAYKLRFGHAARTRDLVGIFDANADVEPVTVGDQREFFERWMQSFATGREDLVRKGLTGGRPR